MSRFSNWMTRIGPGAIMASLTIGAGELVFSARGGSLFGYSLLFYFLLICLMKWGMVWITARNMVLTGKHPFDDWSVLPGPRSWLPWVFILLGAVAFPVWVGFHAGTVGTLLASLTGTTSFMNGAVVYLWGIFILLAVLCLACSGGYSRLEKIQITLVALMMAGICIGLFFLRPDWLSILKGFIVPDWPHYPDWVLANPSFQDRPEWLEMTTFVGVVGGSGYDYLAYLAYFRAKGWVPSALQETQRDRMDARLRSQLLSIPLLDGLISFLAVLVFSSVFVIAGTLILAPHHEVPSGGDLLTLQARFVAFGPAWFKQVYYAGALLAMAGTLYGTLEIAPAVWSEFHRITGNREAGAGQGKHREWVLLWCGSWAVALLVFSFINQVISAHGQPIRLVALLTPANLFTGVLACGIICLLAVYAQFNQPVKGLRAPIALTGLNLISGLLFLGLGVKGYYDHSGYLSIFIFAGTVLTGMLVAKWTGFRRGV